MARSPMLAVISRASQHHSRTGTSRRVYVTACCVGGKIAQNHNKTIISLIKQFCNDGVLHVVIFVRFISIAVSISTRRVGSRVMVIVFNLGA